MLASSAMVGREKMVFTICVTGSRKPHVEDIRTRRLIGRAEEPERVEESLGAHPVRLLVLRRQLEQLGGREGERRLGGRALGSR